MAAAVGEGAARGVGAPLAVGDGCAAFAAVGDVAAAATAAADDMRCCACCGDMGPGAAGVALPLVAGTLSGVSAVDRSRTVAAAVGEGAPGVAAAAPAGRRLPGWSADCDTASRTTNGEGRATDSNGRHERALSACSSGKAAHSHPLSACGASMLERKPHSHAGSCRHWVRAWLVAALRRHSGIGACVTIFVCIALLVCSLDCVCVAVDSLLSCCVCVVHVVDRAGVSVSVWLRPAETAAASMWRVGSARGVSSDRQRRRKQSAHDAEGGRREKA